MLSPMDCKLLSRLTHRVKVFSMEQVATLWNAKLRSTRTRLQRLECLGFVSVSVRMSAPDYDLDRPLVVWKRGEPTPIFRQIVRVLRTRWGGPLLPVTVVTATKKAAGRFGGLIRPVRNSELSHDLALSSVFLQKVTESPELEVRWISEVHLVERWSPGEPVPDALLKLPPHGQVVEVGGSSYRAAKLVQLHEYCESAGLYYEVW